MPPAFLVIVFNYVTTAVLICRSFLSRKWVDFFQGCNNYIMLVLFASVNVCVCCALCVICEHVCVCVKGKRGGIIRFERKLNQMKMEMHLCESVGK